MTDRTLQTSSRVTHLIVISFLIAACLAISAPVYCAANSPARFDSAGTGNTIPLEFFLKSARAAYHNQQWEIAEMEYQNVLLRESTHMAAILELAEVYERLGKFEHARGLLSRASALDGGNKKLIKRALELDQKLCQSLHLEVDTLLAHRSFELALPKLALLMTLQPENPDLYYQKSLCHYHLSRYDIALETIETALRLRGEIIYHDLHQLILNRMKQLEIHALMQQAASVINPNTEADRQSVLILLAKIIEIDPDNGWAKQEFLRLSENEATAAAAAETDRSWSEVLVEKAGGSARRVFPYLGAQLSKNMEALLLILAILLVLHSPLTRLLMKGFPHRALLSGELSRFNITEILTLINSHDYTGTLVIKGDSISGSVYFDHGEAYHCKTRQAAGREAFRLILDRANTGRFYFTETKPPVERTLDIPLHLLIMDLPEHSPLAQPLQSQKRAKSKITELLENR